MPAEWLPAEVPAGARALEAFTVESDSSETADWRVALVARDRVGRVSADVRVSASPTITPFEPTEQVTELRGQPAALGPEVTRGGPTGATSAFWSEHGTDYYVTSVGLSDEALRAFLERARIDASGVQDPAGRFTTVARPTFAAARITTVGLGRGFETSGDPPVELIVQQFNDHVDRGIATAGGVLPNMVGLESGRVGGRPAMWGRLDDERNIVLSETDSGQPIYAFGSASTEHLLALVGSTSAVQPSDPRLAGVRIGDPRSGITTWCRPTP